MSTLKIYRENSATPLDIVTDHDAIATKLHAVGVRFERWRADQPLTETSTNDEIIAAYRNPVDRLKTAYGFQSCDVVALRPDHPDRVPLRNKFLDEHTHADFEVRFFVDGQGLFYIHEGGKVYGVMCEKGDLISVPANTRHWFDMGPTPRFKCIRLFTTPEGWVANYTGNPIAKTFPAFDAF